MFRLYFSIFWKTSSQLFTGDHVHESGDSEKKEFHSLSEKISMGLPLVLLAAGAVFAGFIPFSDFLFWIAV